MTGRWFSPGTPVSLTNNTDRHNILITDILLKVALNAFLVQPLLGTHKVEGLGSQIIQKTLGARK